MDNKQDGLATKEDSNTLRDEIVDHFDKTTDQIIYEFTNKIDTVLQQYA